MIGCLGEERVIDLVEGRVPARELDAMTLHLDACDACRRLVAAAARAAPDTRATAAVLARGTSVGRYVVLDRSGAGSMGVVYAAYDPELDRRVALKLLRTDAFAMEGDAGDLRARLLREARALAQLSHPNVVTLYDVGTHEGQIFLAMEFVVGGTLSDWLHAAPRSVPEIMRVFLEAGRGLAAAHDAGFVHRDFKPENVLVGRDDRVRVSDFGLARTTGGELRPPVADGEATGRPPAIADTRTGARVGTPAYMAPEQWLGQPTDARTDVFSFSVALHEALYGQRPFEGETTEALQRAVTDNGVRAVSRAGVPAALRKALLRGLRADPGERPPSMQPMLDALTLRSRANVALTAALGVAALAALGAIVALARSGGARPSMCASAEAAWGDTYDAAHDASVRRAFAEAGPGSEAPFDFVRRTLGAYGASWVAMHRDACEATHVRGQQSPALLDLRMRCLDERRLAARALVRSLEAGGPGIFERGNVAVTGLARIEDCADARTLTEPVAMPGEAKTRARIEAVLGRTAEVEAEAIKPIDALGAIEPLLSEARALGWAPLTARLLYDHAYQQSILRANREAERELHEAAELAEASGADLVALDALTRLTYVVGYQEERAEEGLLWSRYARAVLTRTHAGDAREGNLESNVALLLLYDESRLDEARAGFVRALELAQRVSGPDSLAVARARVRLAIAEDAEGRYAEGIALERTARETFDRLLGPDNVPSAISLGNEGADLVNGGRPADAMPLLERSIAMQKRLGRSYETPLVSLAEAQRKVGKPEDALGSDRAALALVEPNEAPGSSVAAPSVVGIALDLLALGRAREALPYAERAMKLRTDVASSHERAEAMFALARALWETGDRRRARGLAEQARAATRPSAAAYGGLYAATLSEIDAWLSTHPG